MKRIIFTILLLFLFITNAESQYSHLAKFFPLAVGNKWVYGHETKLPPSYTIHQYQITKDTIIDGFTYYYLDEYIFVPSWIRFDTLTGNLFLRADGKGCFGHPNDYVLDSLNARTNDEIACSEPPFLIHQCLESSDSIKKFYDDSFIARRRYYKYGVGIETYIFTEGIDSYHILRGYVINGIVHGDTALTGISQISNEIPGSYKLSQNFPNPFNPSTKILFEIPSNQFVSIQIYDLTGKLISGLVNERISAGSYVTTFQAQDLPSGVYYYKLSAGNFTEVKKMILLK